jgi:DeoR family transcriptional regulator, suf operon transcriptional repressor
MPPSSQISASSRKEESNSSDESLLDLLRRRGGLTVLELEEFMQVTATAVRQRLSRMSAMGLVERKVHKAKRGRPVHRYELTAKGRRLAGDNFADLATVLWEELREIQEPQVRKGLLQRVSDRLSRTYRDKVNGASAGERMQAISELFSDRKVPFATEAKNGLPVLTALACPYPDLAEKDRSICAMERMLFSDLVGEKLTLESCRLDGDSCCSFELSNANHSEPGKEVGLESVKPAT